MANHIKESETKKGYYNVEKTVYFKPKNFNKEHHEERLCFKKIRKSNFRTKKDAKNWLAIKEGEVRIEIQQRFEKKEEEAVKKSILTLNQVHTLKNNQSKSKGTKKKYQNIFDTYIKPYFDVEADVKNELTTEKLGSWIIEVEQVFEKKKLSPSTKYIVLTRIKQIFSFAMAKQNIESDILDLINVRKPLGHQIDYKAIWTKEEIKEFLHYLKDKHLIYQVFYNIMERGLRFNEVRGLKVSDLFKVAVDDKTKYKLNIERQIDNGSSNKTSKPKSHRSERQIYITKEVYNMAMELVKLHKLETEDFLFKIPYCESVWDTKKIRKVFNDYKHEFTPHKKKMRPHMLRHRIATDALYNKIDVVSIAKHLGDRPEEIFKTYVLNGASKETLLDI